MLLEMQPFDPDHVRVEVVTSSGTRFVEDVIIRSYGGSTLHVLAAKSLLYDLENDQSWIHAASNNEGRAREVAHLVRREAERLGCKYFLTGKWTSFVAVEEGEAEIDNEEAELMRERGRVSVSSVNDSNSDSDSDSESVASVRSGNSRIQRRRDDDDGHDGAAQGGPGQHSFRGFLNSAMRSMTQSANANPSTQPSRPSGSRRRESRYRASLPSSPKDPVSEMLQSPPIIMSPMTGNDLPMKPEDPDNPLSCIDADQPAHSKDLYNEIITKYPTSSLKKPKSWFEKMRKNVEQPINSKTSNKDFEELQTKFKSSWLGGVRLKVNQQKKTDKLPFDYEDPEPLDLWNSKKYSTEMKGNDKPISKLNATTRRPEKGDSLAKMPDHFRLRKWRNRGSLVSKPTSTTKLSTLIQNSWFKTEEQMRQELIAHRIIRLQGADGCFALPRMTALLGRGYEECMLRTRLCTSSHIESEDAISTAIAVVLLQEACALCERLWRIIVGKAMSYVDSRIPLHDSLYSDIRVLVQDYLRDGKFNLSDDWAQSYKCESPSRAPAETLTALVL